MASQKKDMTCCNVSCNVFSLMLLTMINYLSSILVKEGGKKSSTSLALSNSIWQDITYSLSRDC